jgi:hypothetical protein
MSKILSALAVSVLLLIPAPARADVLLTPFLGVTFGGDTPNEQVNFGASLAFLGAGILGLELDAAITPNFFDSDDDAVPLEDSNVSTFMANLMLAAPGSIPGIRPYASGGVGLIRTKATSVGNLFDDIDIDLGGFNFWRGSLGVTFRF